MTVREDFALPARRVLLAVAAFLVLALVVQLYRGPYVPSAFQRGLWHLSIALGLCGAGLAALARPGRRAVWAAASLSLVVFLSNMRTIATADSAAVGFLPYSVVRHGTLALDQVVPRDEPLPYWITVSRGRLWSFYPVATSLLALPVYLPTALGPTRPGTMPDVEKLAASILAALSVGMVMAVLLRLELPLGRAWLVTALYALGSPVWSTNAQALWQHGPSCLALALALWSLVRARREPRFSLLAGMASALAINVRPTDALFALSFFAIAWREGGSRQACRFALGALPLLVLLAAYNTLAFGLPWRNGQAGESVFFGWTPHARELLLSPSHGLLPYAPWTALAFVGLVVGARRQFFYAALLAGTAATFLVFNFWQPWHGGWCFGPRLLSDLMPALAIGCVPLVRLPGRSAVAALALTGAMSILVNALGVYLSRDEAIRTVFINPSADWADYPPFAELRARLLR